MPPKGGHGGGHHGGGHHGGGGHHHHHHGRGGIVGGPVWYGGGYPWWYDSYPSSSEVFVTNPCPDVIDPVIGIDGKQYLNACKANQAGVAVKSKAKASPLKDYVTTSDYVTTGDYVTTSDFDIQKYVWGPIGWAASLAMIYHGYKRNNSVLWGLLWGLTGVFGVPFAVAQGFGKRKTTKNPSRLRRYR